MNLVIKDAFRQILGRVASAIGGFVVIKLITPYLGPLRFGDYSTILKYFAIFSAFADFGLYVIALKTLGTLRDTPDKLQEMYGKFVATRWVMIVCVYTLALLIAYLLPAYTSNPYLVWGLPLGMLFSAAFMSAGILQIPLQLNRKMEQLSIALILARVTQISLLVGVIFVRWVAPDFSTTNGITPFMLIITSVVLSGLTQLAYVWYTGKKYLSHKPLRDRSFSKNLLKSNRQYGLAYYMSSFHTLAVLILLSNFYPTTQGFTYVGTWALALSLIEILLIVPSALGNSMIHKVAADPLPKKLGHYGNLLTLVFWIGCFIVMMFTLFAPHVIYFIGGADYLASGGNWGSDTLLPYFAVILTFSFVKQVFNYIFVSTDHQNKLLRINTGGVVVGLAIGIPLLLRYGLVGGLIMQALLEVCFVVGAIIIAHKHKVIPSFSARKLSFIALTTGILTYICTQIISISPEALLQRIGTAGILSAIYVGISYPLVKKIMKGL